VKLSNEMVINAPADQAWELLTDLGRIAPIMPGAVLEKVEGDQFSGTLSVKIGPIAVKYRGTTRFHELDQAARKVVISARGSDASGQGSVEALITARLTPEGNHTRVLVDTDLNISGRLAQFGRGALADVSARLMTQFVRNLDAALIGMPAESGVADAATVASEAPVDSVDLLGVIGPVLARRAAPVLAGAMAGALVGALAMRRLMRGAR
jgi:carbon monoxide dehydrogenase subunit G